MKKLWKQQLLISLLLVALALSGCGPGAPAENGPEEAPEAPAEADPSDEQEVNDEERAPGEEPPEAAVQEMDLYFMEVKETSFEVGVETREFEGPEVGPEQLMEALLAGPRAEHLTRALPEEVELRDVFVEEGIAYVDFSADITGIPLGGESEAVLVNSIVWTLTQLEAVEAVQILVEGEIIESLGGHVLIEEPLR